LKTGPEGEENTKKVFWPPNLNNFLILKLES
jgi:hypothetical protein